MASKKKPDLDDIILAWARDYLQRKGSRGQRKLLEKEMIGMEIDWKRVKFVHHAADYEPKPSEPGSGKPMSNVIFNTTFTNRTERPQTYTFHADRTTKSSCTVQVEQGYVMGMEMNVKLTTPGEFLELNAGFKREMSLTNIEGETIEQELTWGVNSQVEVQPGHVGEAKLIILEEKYDGRFTVKTEISGKVRVIFTDLKNNNSFLKAIESPLVDLVKEATTDMDTFVIDGDKKKVIGTTKGECHFRFGVRQLVEVDQKPIDQ